jgi:AcrR family transcriptional regulator
MYKVIHMKTATKARTKGENQQQLRTEATLEKLLDAAEKVFVRDGFEKARIETIAEAIGRTKGAVYAHFESKEDLFIALLEQKIRLRLQSIQEAITGRPPQQQRTIARDLFVSGALEEDWPILVLEFKLFALRSAVSKDRVAALYRLLTDDATQIFFGGDARQKGQMKLASVVLRGIPSALALEGKFDPVLRGNREGIKRILRTFFDSVLPEWPR